MTPLERYLEKLDAIHSTGAGVAETSYYPALEALLSGVGATLSPAVRCVLTLRDQGAGLPDGGLFTAEQWQSGEPLENQRPTRGVIEAKPVSAEVGQIVASEQVRRYLEGYGLVLVTNYRAFRLVARGKPGQPPVTLEQYEIAPDEASFWQAARRAQDTAAQYNTRLVEFLQRAMQYAAPLRTSADVAWFLASYAREALALLGQGAAPIRALDTLRAAFEEALGIRFEGERGDHFFRSTLVQTLFYGVFSAWVLWHRETAREPSERFDWRLTPWLIRVPMIRALFEQVALPSRLGPLGLVGPLGRAADTLNRVEADAFFATFAEELAVQHFYEPFLEQFDPALRRELGVWYTPPEIVNYMVARVDRVLREELGIAEGLADERVLLLDPACGTGAYLVAALKQIAATLQQQGIGALLAADLKRAATERLFGFEILPAPFVVAHLQLGLLLQQYGIGLDDERERVGVYLTNALTGWNERSQPPLPLPEFQEEREAAENIKRHKKILVVLGNPPYNGYAGMAVEEERDLSDAYRTTRRAPKPQGQGLNDLYVRFYRMAERQIVERAGHGVVCFISNNSWLDGLSHTGMRERYLEVFDRIWIDNLHGDKYKTGKKTPWGEPDPSVFSTEMNRAGIQVGTAIALMVRHEQHQGTRTIFYRDFWGRNKRRDLGEVRERGGEEMYGLEPPPELGLPFAPSRHQGDYLAWPLLTELFPESFPGVKTSRDEELVDIERDMLEARMRAYFDPAVSHREMAEIAPRLMEDTGRFEAIPTREYLQRRGFIPENIVRYCYRPFDLRWLYWEPETSLVDRNRADYFPHVFEGNVWLSATQRNRKADFYQPQVTTRLADHHIVESNVGMFPLLLAPTRRNLFDQDNVLPRPNLSEQAWAYLEALGAEPEALFYHTLAILHAPAYRSENAGALRQDWPRLPLPDDLDTLLASAALGRHVASLLDPEARPTVPLDPTIALISHARGGQLDPATDLALTAGWGYAGRGGITMPGRGRVEIHHGVDVYLNDVAYWGNVPVAVWEYTLGGYQVLKKWLSYREEPLLGRALTVRELREVSDMARRIAALLSLAEALDASYARARGG